MKILVIGAGVIGSNLAADLFTSAKDVTLLTRGKWAETLEKNGLIIDSIFFPGKKNQFLMGQRQMLGNKSKACSGQKNGCEARSCSGKKGRPCKACSGKEACREKGRSCKEGTSKTGKGRSGFGKETVCKNSTR